MGVRGAGKSEARGLKRYLRALLGRVSGEALLSNARSLLRTLEGWVDPATEEAIRAELPILRRDANKALPPRQQASQPVSLGMVRDLVERAKTERLTRREQQALDIFVLAFSTVSRVGEIAVLGVEDVAPDGSSLTLRPKTQARTWQRLCKRVTNAPGLRATDILLRYREAARKKRRGNLFVGAGGSPPTTSAITGHLRKLGKRLSIPARITSHSARKGAAVTAVLAGVPLPIVQALGGWRDINSLQAYIGEAVRRSTSLMQLLEGGGGGQKGDKWRAAH